MPHHNAGKQQPAPMPRTRWASIAAGSIRQQTFTKTGIGRRGYRPNDVDRFLDHLAQEIDRWAAECAAIQVEVDRLRDYYRRQGVDPDTTDRHAVSAEAVAVLVSAARRCADHLVRTYRTRAPAGRGSGEGVERMAVLGRAILAALDDTSAIPDQAIVQTQVIISAFAAELSPATASARRADTYVGRATPPTTGSGGVHRRRQEGRVRPDPLTLARSARPDGR